MDIFHHDNSIIHQNTNGKNQSKQGNPVQGISCQIINKESQRQGYRDSDCHHHRISPSQHQSHQENNRDSSNSHVIQEFIGFFLGGFPIVPGDCNLQIRRNQISPEGFDLMEDILGYRGGIGSFPFCQRNSNRWLNTFPYQLFRDMFFLGHRTCPDKDILDRFLRTISHFSHIFQKNRPLIKRTNHQVLHILSRGNKST